MTRYEIIVGKLHIYRKKDIFYLKVRITTFELISSLYLQVEADMEKVRNFITNPENLTIHMAVNVQELTKDGLKPQNAWLNLVPEDVTSTKAR